MDTGELAQHDPSDKEVLAIKTEPGVVTGTTRLLHGILSQHQQSHSQHQQQQQQQHPLILQNGYARHLQSQQQPTPYSTAAIPNNSTPGNIIKEKHCSSLYPAA